MTGAADWQGRVGANWAREWQRTDRTLAGVNPMLAARAAAVQPHHVLDIGCGAGATAVAVADLCAAAAVLGIDLSAELIAAADARGHPRCGFRVADATRWEDPACRPDLLISRHGVMFFDDPVAAFTQLRTAAMAGARLIFSCFRDRTENPWATVTADAVGAPPPGAGTGPGPFAFADRTRVAALLAAAGWHGIGFEAVTWDYVAGAGPDPVADAVAFFSRIGPAAATIARLDPPARAAAVAALHAVLTEHRADG
ncbi:MAG TPA: class I SAM-dependent methyltransferase, partial [Sphingomonas sp.]|uniref:class I SAM-dependent methyltransferase n=1 Tax=Sphingomonas sp. TaxID=28214 RepID=UPI002ED9B4CB